MRSVSINFLVVVVIIIFIFGLLFVDNYQKNTHTRETIRVGAIRGPEIRLLETARHLLWKKQHIKLVIINYQQYDQLNRALVSHEIDANAFQHWSYLQHELLQYHYNITPIAKTFCYPMGIYSKKLKQLTDIKPQMIIAIPNDLANEKRSLQLLQAAGLIKLDPKNLLFIINNPKKLTIKLIAADQLVRFLFSGQADLAVINTNYAIMSRLYPNRDALFLENRQVSLNYANLIVVRTAEKDRPLFQALIQAFHSQPVINEARYLFHGNAIPAWIN